MKRVRDVLNGKEKNSIMPFFWQHGEDRETLSLYMDKICESGCGGVCIEARPHPAFGEEQWWGDVSCIIEKAKQNAMEVWILDDSHFPTGYANGVVKEKYPQYLKRYLDCRRFDVVGPLKYARMNLRFLKGKPWQQKGREHDRILGVYAAQRAAITEDKGRMQKDAVDPVLAETMIDITDKLSDGILYWNIPEGNWSIFVVFTTREGGEETTRDYLNPLVKEATQVLIEAVYEPHFTHFGKEFGTTITAFFSDEPRLGNAKGTDCCIGEKEMVLPWREGMESDLPFSAKYLPFLFVDSSDATMNRIRYEYMDTVSRLYSENFTQVLGTWCRAHGVKYVGHHIEDNGAHQRLGYGAGHLFRAQKGQDFSGIDVISNQIAPGYTFHHDAFATGGHNGEFYHYALAHLGASIAQNDPEKQGIAMCEAFGAYGWNEGLKWMKWITDHLLARGINYFVPHAFDPKSYPDWDCPPHFYAHGHNPQFRYFSILMQYIQRMCWLLQGGVHATSVAVLYPAEGEWCGGAQPLEKVLRVLDQNQVESMVVSLDDVKKAAEHAEFYINKNKYEYLIIPSMRRIPEELEEIIPNLESRGVKVLFAEKYPKEIYEAMKTVHTSEYQSALTSYHYMQEDGELIFLFNEDPNRTIHTTLTIHPIQKEKGLKPVAYDAFTNHLTELSGKEIEDGENHRIQIPLDLAPYESKVLLIQKDWNGYTLEKDWRGEICKKVELDGEWKLAYADVTAFEREKEETEDGFRDLGSRDCLIPLSEEPEFRDKSGTLRYRKKFQWEQHSGNKVFLHMEHAYETVEVWVNEKKAGICLCPPYRLEITNCLKDGANSLTIDVTNTLGNENKEFMSQYTPIEPFGLDGKVFLEEEKRNIP